VKVINEVDPGWGRKVASKGGVSGGGIPSLLGRVIGEGKMATIIRYGSRKEKRGRRGGGKSGRIWGGVRRGNESRISSPVGCR